MFDWPLLFITYYFLPFYNPLSSLLQTVFIDDKDLIIEDVDFSDTHLLLIIREGRKLRICSVPLPLRNEMVTKFHRMFFLVFIKDC